MKVFDLISMNSEQADIIGLARQICEKELLPHVAELDREGRYPVEIDQKFKDAGLYALEVPKQYGGMGVDCSTIFLMAELLGYYDAGFGFTFHATLVPDTMKFL